MTFAPFLVQQSRYDLAGIDMATFRTRLTDYVEHTVYHTGTTQLTPNYPDDWWSRLMLDCRFQCDPYLIDGSTGARALNSRTMAMQSWMKISSG